MNRTRRRHYTAGDEQQVREALQQLENDFEVKGVSAEGGNERYYDTFSADLYGAGCLLKKRGRKLFLCRLDDEMIARGSLPAGRHFFPADISDEQLRQLLRARAGIRALLPICSRQVDRESFELRNADRKTVVRLHSVSGTAAADGRQAELQPLIHLDEVRGYETEFEKASLLLADAGLAPADVRNGLDLALAGLGLIWPRYSSKYVLDLDADIGVHDGVVAIGRYLLASMEENYTGVIGDIDTEFLHDFRIALRRTRSLLSQMKKYLPQRQLGFFQTEFKWLGSVTGPVRDLDVYLLMRKDYGDMLPLPLHRGLGEFFEELERQRAARFESMREALAFERYARIMREWQQFLSEEKETAAWPNGGQQLRPIVKKAIRRRFLKIMKAGAKIDADSGDDALHSLRIQGKKLRYMLEFFRSFYAEEDIVFFHRQLKKLQNTLGDFNDISVQLEMLQEHAGLLRPGSKRSLRISAAVGGLITHLAWKHKDVRRKFEKTFSVFASEKNQKRFEKTLT